MMKVLLRAPETFLTPFSGSRDRALPIQFGRLNMIVDSQPKGCWLSASFNAGHRKITVSSKFYDGYEDGVLPDDLFESYGEFNRSVNIWWDVGRCPPPLNFDVSNIGITIIDAMCSINNTSRPIYLRVYGKSGDLLSKMAKDTVRIISDSGFKLAGIELIDDGGSNFVSDLIDSGQSKYFDTGLEKTLMMKDLLYHGQEARIPPTPIHMVILDGKVITASDFYRLGHRYRYRNCLICEVSEHESVDGVWRWKPLWPVQSSILMGQCKSNGGGNSLDEHGLSDGDANMNSLDEGGLSDDDATIDNFENNKIVSIWWDFLRCPFPSNFDTPKIASNITKFLRRLNLFGGPIYFHMYGNIQEIGEDVIRFVCESGFQIIGFQLVDSKRSIFSFLTDLEFDFYQRSDLLRPPVINIVISNGYRYLHDGLAFLRDLESIIMPFEILLDEGPQGGGLPHELCKDDGNIFLEHFAEFEYLVGRQSRGYKSVNIWWDASRCPPPSNFDLSKIGITIVEVMRLINTPLPIHLHVYGNRCELLPKMAKDTKRIIAESGFKLIGFELKDNSNVSDFVFKGFQRDRKHFSAVLEENLMLEDLIYYGHQAPPQAIHMVVLDGKVITATALDRRRCQINCCVIYVEPEQEAVDGVWRWMPLQPAVA